MQPVWSIRPEVKADGRFDSNSSSTCSDRTDGCLAVVHVDQDVSALSTRSAKRPATPAGTVKRTSSSAQQMFPVVDTDVGSAGVECIE
jgi:hypothetical protein